jgi:hypothetical protein
MNQINPKRKVSLLLALPFSFFLLLPFSSELSPLSAALNPAPAEPSERNIRPNMALTAREKKMVAILSQFKTGLQEREKERLVIFISEESRRYGFDPELIVALISTESSFNNWSSSSKGAIGLMQIVPTTGRELAEINNIVWRGEEELLFDPFLNIKLGVHYLSMLHLRFKDIELALSAYNYGPGNIRRWIDEGEPIPAGYATKVVRSYEKFLAFDMTTQKASDLFDQPDDPPSVDDPALPREKTSAGDVSKVSVRF